jgi:3'(2'), 5'-bisphosphate nucleotidase
MYPVMYIEDFMDVTLPTTIAGFPADQILSVARSTGWGAAAILQTYYRGETPAGSQAGLNVQDGKDGPVTSADLAANHYILERLTGTFGHDTFGYLSEETYKAQGRPQPVPQDWLWIIDPLDGTRDFIDRTGEYALHIALTYQGRPMLTVVVCPELGKLYYATLGNGAFVETPDGTTQKLAVSQRHQAEDLVVVMSRTHRDERFNKLLAQLPCQTQIAVGSVGGKIAAVVEQRADVYISLSGKSAPKDWDMAAPELILTEAGGQFTYMDETPLQYNRGDVNQWGCLIASNGQYHADLCRAARDLLAAIDGTPAQ